MIIRSNWIYVHTFISRNYINSNLNFVPIQPFKITIIIWCTTKIIYINYTHKCIYIIRPFAVNEWKHVSCTFDNVYVNTWIWTSMQYFISAHILLLLSLPLKLKNKFLTFFSVELFKTSHFKDHEGDGRRNLIWFLGKWAVQVMDWTGSGSCPLVGFGIWTFKFFYQSNKIIKVYLVEPSGLGLNPTIATNNIKKVSGYDNQSPEDRSTANSRNVMYMKYTSDNGQCPAWCSYMTHMLC
jgi:hypothetical protein